MNRILIIEKNNHARALLQCRLAAEVKIKFASCMEAAWGKINSRKYDLIVWNATADSAGEINLRHTISILSTKTLGARTIVFTTADHSETSPLCDDNIYLKKYPFSDEEYLSFIRTIFLSNRIADRVSPMSRTLVFRWNWRG